MVLQTRLIKQIVCSVLLGMVLLPTASPGQTEESLEELVLSYLWPSSNEEFQKAQTTLKKDNTLADVSRELRTQPQTYSLLVWRDGQQLRLETHLMLGPNANSSKRAPLRN